MPALSEFPADYRPLLGCHPVFNSSCSPNASVYYIPQEEGLYLKKAPKGALEKEARLTAWFSKKGLAPRVLDYRSEDADWMLTKAAKGEDCTHFCHDPAQLSKKLAHILRDLHARPFADCPEQNRLNSYFSTAKENFEKRQFDLSYSYGAPFQNAEEAFSLIEKEGRLLKADTLIHGDYCLPNILLKDWQFSAFIDLGGAGVGDRHIDLFWGIWTLQFNLKTDRYRKDFIEAYGPHLIEEDRLRLISAFEIFG